MTYMSTPQHKNPCPEGHEIDNLVDPSLVIITTYLVCLIYAFEYRRRFLQKCINLILFTQKLPPIGLWNQEITFLSPCNTDATYQIWLRLTQ